uniref:protein-tyrosine-phosphatase n=1 Tax=Anopheles farauti TaxID=69004 RepID=A0A182QZF9_9DIPT
MLKAIVFLGLLLVSGWTLSGAGVAAADCDVTISSCALPQAPHHQFEPQADSFYSATKCRPTKLNITVVESVLNIPEWQEEPSDKNIVYELKVFWHDVDRMTSKREELPVIRDYLLPVQDQCIIYWIRVCRINRVSSDCVCGTWSAPQPDFGEVQVLQYGVDEKSYVAAWNVSRQECVRFYTVQQTLTEVQTDVSYVKLESLEACGRYRLHITALLANGESLKKSVEIFSYPTSESVIDGALQCAIDFTVQELNETSESELINEGIVNVSYTDPNLTNAIVCTVPKAFSNPVSCEGIKHTTKAPVQLKTNPSYKVHDPPVPNLCPGRTTGLSGDVTIKPSPIGPVRDLRANTDIDRCVVLTWRPPKEGTQCVKEYLITWASESKVIESTSTFYNVTNLEPCTTYEFTVNAIDYGNDKGTPESITAMVRELQQLSSVTELEINEVEPRSLSVKWKPPINGTNCVESYRVVAWYNAPDTGKDIEVFSNTTTDQHVTFGEVIACQVYTVQVIPVSISKKDGLNFIGSLKTKERTILSYHVEPIRAVTVKARSLELSTMLLSENNNNCLLVSVRFNCTMTKEGEPVPETQVWRDFVIPSSNTSFEGILEPLDPYSMYQCNAQIQNIAGLSDPTPFYEFQTAEDVPESPDGVELIGQNRSITIIWKAPIVKNGVVVRYRIHVRMIAPEYPLPKLCDPLEEFNETVDLRDEVNPDVTRSWDGDGFQHSVTNLNPYTLYTVQVAAATGAGFGAYTEMGEVVTLPDVSNVTASFRIDSIVGPELNKTYQSEVSLSWEIPCGLHGRLTRFVGMMRGTREQDFSSPHELAWEVHVAEDEEIRNTYSYAENRLKPEYNYTVSVSVEVANVPERSPEAMLQFESPAGIPTINHTEEWFNVNVLDAPNPTNTARIVLGNITLAADIGSIRYMALLISERQCQQDPEPRTGFINNTGTTQWPEVPDWYRANNMRCVEQYQTTPKFWNPMQRAAERAVVGPIEYVVGKEDCDRGQEYCNGPLKPGTEYALIVRIFSRSGYTDSELQMFRTDSRIKVGLIVSAVLACLLLAFIGGYVVMWRKQRLLLPAQQAGRAPTEEPADIPLKNFPNQYDELFQSNREKVSKEFQAINYFSDFALQETVSFQSARENERKNRYVNILPFDSNRVLLDTNENEEDGEGSASDYINASFIEGYKYQREYIATQGPKLETCGDFWRMVLQYEIESIVMLTQPIDHDKNKCCQYYPRFNQYTDYGDIRVKCTQELNLSLYYKRLFLVSRGNLTKAVFHYHFLDWPDHSCPANAVDLIKFSKIVRAERKSYAIPLVVHCSAGVGRTGTFIALDIILQRMQQEKKINVYDVVKRLRRQRVKMVQTLDQYTFLYQCCLEYVSKSNRKKPKTSNIEVIRRDDKGKSPYPDVILEVGEQQQVSVANGGKPLFNIKFPKSVNSGLANVTSFAPSEMGGDK